MADETTSVKCGPVAAEQISIEKIKEGMRAIWIAGDFGMLAKRMTSDAEAFIARLALPRGSHVLDVATGTGNLALPLARAGCVVTGLDIAPNLLEQAQARADAEGLKIEFDEGDAERLPYADASYDAVVTMFGAMFAPRPELVACEMARVLKPGGVLAMANWNPESFSGEVFRVTAKHVPPPPGVVRPVQWGVETVVRERLADRFDAIECKLLPLKFEMAVPPAGMVEFFRTWFGPTKVAFSRLDEKGQVALKRDLVKLWTKANTAEDPEGHTLIDNEYLEVRAVRK